MPSPILAVYGKNAATALGTGLPFHAKKLYSNYGRFAFA